VETANRRFHPGGVNRQSELGARIAQQPVARPSGNITGLSLPDLIGKRLEIFRQAVPNLSRVTVLINAANQSYARRYSESVQDDGHELELAIQAVEVNGPDDLERAFSAITPDAGTGVAAAADVMFYNERKRIAALALASRLPSMFHNEEFVKVGGLLSYGANVPAIFRRSAVYVDHACKTHGQAYPPLIDGRQQQKEE
jgi:putative tryptophan/tyrosine transport system substrate-binding protein